MGNTLNDRFSIILKMVKNKLIKQSLCLGSVVDSVIQATGRMEFEDGFRTPLTGNKIMFFFNVPSKTQLGIIL